MKKVLMKLSIEIKIYKYKYANVEIKERTKPLSKSRISCKSEQVKKWDTGIQIKCPKIYSSSSSVKEDV